MTNSWEGNSLCIFNSPTFLLESWCKTPYFGDGGFHVILNVYKSSIWNPIWLDFKSSFAIRFRIVHFLSVPIWFLWLRDHIFHRQYAVIKLKFLRLWVLIVTPINLALCKVNSPFQVTAVLSRIREAFFIFLNLISLFLLLLFWLTRDILLINHNWW